MIGGRGIKGHPYKFMISFFCRRCRLEHSVNERASLFQNAFSQI